MQRSVLLVTADPFLSSAVDLYLRGRGILVTCAATAREALRAAAEHLFDAVVLADERGRDDLAARLAETARGGARVIPLRDPIAIHQAVLVV